MRLSSRRGHPSYKMWEPRPRGGGWWSARLHRGEGAAPTILVGAPPSGRWVVFCEAFIATRALLLQNVGAPPSGRWVVVSEDPSRRGCRSYKMWEPRPRRWVVVCEAFIATRASRLQNVGAPPSGRWGVVCEAFIATRALLLQNVGAPPSGRWGVVSEASSRQGHHFYKIPFIQTSSGRIHP